MIGRRAKSNKILRNLLPYRQIDDFDSWGDLYILTVKVTDVTGETMEFQKWIRVDYPYKPEIELKHFFKSLEGEDVIGAEVVAGTKETWMIAELYGSGNKLLDARVVHFSPSEGKFATSTLSYPYSAEYPDAVELKLLYFQDKDSYTHSVEKRRKDHTYDMPLAFERFLTPLPRALNGFTIRTGPGPSWQRKHLRQKHRALYAQCLGECQAELVPMPDIYFNDTPGIDHGRTFYGRIARNVMATKASGGFGEIGSLAEEVSYDMAPPTAHDEGSAASTPRNCHQGRFRDHNSLGAIFKSG